MKRRKRVIPVRHKSNQGKRADLDGKFFRSSWEANYARYLNHIREQGRIVGWEYEVDTFWFYKIKRGNRSYTPDFKVYYLDNEVMKFFYVEVKGWMNADSKVKLKRMKKFYPDIKVTIVDGPKYKEIMRNYKNVIKGWEESKR